MTGQLVDELTQMSDRFAEAEEAALRCELLPVVLRVARLSLQPPEYNTRRHSHTATGTFGELFRGKRTPERPQNSEQNSSHPQHFLCSKLFSETKQRKENTLEQVEIPTCYFWHQEALRVLRPLFFCKTVQEQGRPSDQLC